MPEKKPASQTSKPADHAKVNDGQSAGAPGKGQNNVPATGAAPNKPTVAGAAQSAPVQVGRRAPGAKEPIPFQWKLIGRSHDLIVTLFKAIEREEVEAQQARVAKDGYYTGLQILDVNAVVAQPKPKRRRSATGADAKKSNKKSADTIPKKIAEKTAKPTIVVRTKKSDSTSAKATPKVIAGKTAAEKAARPTRATSKAKKKTTTKKTTRSAKAAKSRKKA